MSLLQFEIPVAAGLAALAAIAFIIARVRQRGREFSLMDGLLLVMLMATATAGGIVFINGVSQYAKKAAVRENLQTLRTQIEAYKLQHRGEPPVLFNGSFPQLTEATDAEGIPGPAGKNHAYGPYFRSGVPVNALTGQNVVTPADTFPPMSSSGNGGWLYHQQSGRLAIDSVEYLKE
jgi:general secretion pathway protein G